jgi:predicted O-linked N-acetylglucosamine transferase (SPINDLY family)
MATTSEALAVALANDLPRLAALRAGLRARMAVSSLCDTKRSAQGLTDVLRNVWRERNCPQITQIVAD